MEGIHQAMLAVSINRGSIMLIVLGGLSTEPG